VVMLRMSFSWQYTLSTLLVEGAGKVSRSAAAMTMFWLVLAKVGHRAPSRLMAAMMSLARARALVNSTFMVCSVSSVDLRWCSLVIWASMDALSPGSSPRYCMAPC
jgi:hypothetical protein